MRFHRFRSRRRKEAHTLQLACELAHERQLSGKELAPFPNAWWTPTIPPKWKDSKANSHAGFMVNNHAARLQSCSSNGLNSFTPNTAKSLTFRVATVQLCALAVAAINESRTS